MHDQEDTTMKSVNIKRYIFSLGLVIFLAAMTLPATTSLAKSGGSLGVPLPDHYPEAFSGSGCIQRITAKEVVIDDSLYTFASDVTFHSLSAFHATRSTFRKKVKVGFVESAPKVIESLWYLERCR
jgi:hypothetical protein